MLHASCAQHEEGISKVIMIRSGQGEGPRHVRSRRTSKGCVTGAKCLSPIMLGMHSKSLPPALAKASCKIACLVHFGFMLPAAQYLDLGGSRPRRNKAQLPLLCQTFAALSVPASVRGALEFPRSGAGTLDPRRSSSKWLLGTSCQSRAACGSGRLRSAQAQKALWICPCQAYHCSHYML